MRPVMARLAAALASYLAVLLTARGVAVLDGDGAAFLEQALARGFDLVLLLGYAVLHPQLQEGRWPPRSQTGADQETGRQP